MLERWARRPRALQRHRGRGRCHVPGPRPAGKLLQDFLNGVVARPLAASVVVDVVVGGTTAALLLHAAVTCHVDGPPCHRAGLDLAVMSALGAILSGLTDYKDTPPSSAERDVAGFHGLVNIVATILFAISLVQRLGNAHDAAFWTLLIGYLVVSVGAYIGGHVVFKYGYMVNVNAFSRGKRAKEFTAVLPAADLAEATPTKAMLGTTTLVLVRRGDVVHALKDYLLPRRRTAHGWKAARRRYPVPVARLGLPTPRRRGPARTGQHAAGALRGPHRRRPGRGPGPA